MQFVFGEKKSMGRLLASLPVVYSLVAEFYESPPLRYVIHFRAVAHSIVGAAIASPAVAISAVETVGIDGLVGGVDPALEIDAIAGAVYAGAGASPRQKNGFLGHAFFNSSLAHQILLLRAERIIDGWVLLYAACGGTGSTVSEY